MSSSWDWSIYWSFRRGRNFCRTVCPSAAVSSGLSWPRSCAGFSDFLGLSWLLPAPASSPSSSGRIGLFLSLWAVVADKAGQEAAKVSGKAVEGLQDASQSLKQWHERRRIFDLQAVVGDDPLGRPACGNPVIDNHPENSDHPAATTISDARDLGNGVEEVRFDASPIEEDVPYDWASDGFEEAESSPEPQTLSQDP